MFGCRNIRKETFWSIEYRLILQNCIKLCSLIWNRFFIKWNQWHSSDFNNYWKSEPDVFVFILKVDCSRCEGSCQGGNKMSRDVYDIRGGDNRTTCLSCSGHAGKQVGSNNLPVQNADTLLAGPFGHSSQKFTYLVTLVTTQSDDTFSVWSMSWGNSKLQTHQISVKY